MERDFRVLRWVTFAALLAVAVAYLLPLSQSSRTDWTAQVILVVLAAVLLTWAIESWIRLLISRAAPSDAARQHERETRLLIDLSCALLGAQNAQEVLQSLMRSGSALSGAAGCSFVPYDSWGKSLPALVSGNLPADSMQTWVETLSNPSTRQACKACQSLGAEGNCLLREAAKHASVRCLAVTRNGRQVGMLNFYFNAAVQLTESQQALLREMVTMADAALQSADWREQSLTLLRQIQSAKPGGDNLQHFLSEIAATLRRALDVDFSLLWLPGMPSGQPAAPIVDTPAQSAGRALSELPDQAFLEGVWQSVVASRAPLMLENISFNTRDLWRNLLVVPLVWGQGDVMGMMMFGSRSPIAFGERQRLLVQTLAGETALLIQNSAQVAQAEFQAVVEERARLAREIHDGLAQTLAFLKMQAAQMQTYLAQGDLSRLTETLRTSGQTLTDAYLDARQAIEQLRRVPGRDLTAWLCQVALDFEATTGLRVDTSRLDLDIGLTPMAQAQLVRIVQEALSNVRKHAQARAVSIAGRVQDDALILEVIDDGRGFSPESVAPNDRFGLRGMRERAEMLGADFQIISQPGSGATVRVRLPLERVR